MFTAESISTSVRLGTLGFLKTILLGGREELAISDFVRGSSLDLTRSDIRIRFRMILGSFALLLQTHHHISSPVTKFDTDSPPNCTKEGDVKGMINAANLIIVSVRSRPLILRYRFLCDSARANDELRTLKATSFSGCGFATLGDSKSIESPIAISPERIPAMERYN